MRQVLLGFMVPVVRKQIPDLTTNSDVYITKGNKVDSNLGIFIFSHYIDRAYVGIKIYD